jgi:hypothetical protein
MDDVRTDRWFALGGPAFLVVAVIALAVSGGDLSEDASPAKAVAHFAEHDDGLLISAFLAGPAAALLLMWAGRFRALLGPEAGVGRSLFQYGAVLLAGAFLLGGLLDLAATSATDKDQAQVAQTVNVLRSDAWIPPIIGVAILLLGAGISVLRTAVLPRWMGWIALVVGVVALLGPGGFLGFLIGPVWIAVSGVLLFLRSPADASEPAAAG